jgi:hypothetical protein
MTDNPRVETLQVYWGLMTEVKYRSAAMIGAIEHKLGLPDFLAREFCYLQLRYICELIALGCLLAHGDIEATKTNKLQQEWAADKILNRLAQLHPDFYPHPHKFERTGPNRVKIAPFIGSFMTREELIRLWRRCGIVLHRGSVQTLRPPTEDFSEIIEARHKLIDLLSFHRLAMLNGQRHMVCIMSNDEGNVHVADIEPVPFEQPPASPPSDGGHE